MNGRLVEEIARNLEVKRLGRMFAATASELDMPCEWLRRPETRLVSHEVGNFHTRRLFALTLRYLS